MNDEEFNELPEIEIDEILADEARSNVAIPVECVVNGHDFNAQHYCVRCGEPPFPVTYYGAY